MFNVNHQPLNKLLELWLKYNNKYILFEYLRIKNLIKLNLKKSK